MAQHTKRVLLLLGILASLLGNVFTSGVPEAWQPYAWLAGAPLFVCVLLIMALESRSVPNATTTPATTNRDHRAVMLRKVHRDWIAGVLHQSLEQLAWLDLGFTRVPDLVAPPITAIGAQPAGAAVALPPGTTLLAVFDAAVGELLILGAPGAGKTTQLLRLTEALLARAQDDVQHPIPVIFNLSTWATQHPPLRDWLISELNARYGVTTHLAQRWVDAGMVLPLLDGLDEVALAQRAACVAAINTFRQPHAGMQPLVVCSRTADYAVLQARLQLASTVTIQPLPQHQVLACLRQAGDRLAGVRTLLRTDLDVWELLDTPLMLSIVMLAYQGQSVRVVRAGGTVDARRAQVFAAYVDRMFARKVGRLPAPEAQVRRWLCWLTAQLVQRQQTVFLIERMQPDWLPQGYRWAPTSGLGLGFGLAGGFAGGVGFGLIGGLVGGLTGLLMGVQKLSGKFFTVSYIMGELGHREGWWRGLTPAFQPRRGPKARGNPRAQREGVGWNALLGGA